MKLGISVNKKEMKSIRCKWVFKIKSNLINPWQIQNKIGSQRVHSKAGTVYEDTYSLVAKFISIRIVMAIVGNLHLEFYQMDVKSTFTNEKYKEEIYGEIKRLWDLKLRG